MVDRWNNLLEEAIEADAITTFKTRLDRYMDLNGLEEYELNAGKWVNLR